MTATRGDLLAVLPALHARALDAVADGTLVGIGGVTTKLRERLGDTSACTAYLRMLWASWSVLGDPHAELLAADLPADLDLLDGALRSVDVHADAVNDEMLATMSTAPPF